MSFLHIFDSMNKIRKKNIFGIIYAFNAFIKSAFINEKYLLEYTSTFEKQCKYPYNNLTYQG